MSFIKQLVIFCVISVYSIYTYNDLYYRAQKTDGKCLVEYFLHSRFRSSSNCRRYGRHENSSGLQANLIQGYISLIADIKIRTEKSREDIDTIVSQIKLLMKNEADRAVNYMTVYLEQTTLYFQVIIHDRKPRNGTHCKETIIKQLGENLQLADENVTLCLALGYQRVQKLPDKLAIHFETLENLMKYSTSKFEDCKNVHKSGVNCSDESQDLERTVFLYETSPFPVVMADIAISGFKEVSDLSVCLKDIVSRMMTHSVKVIGDFNRCIHNIELPKLKYLMKYMKKYV